MIKMSESIVNVSAALVAAQSEFPAVKWNATNKFLGNKYADLGAVIEVVRPILVKHHLAVSHLVIGEGSSVGVVTMLVHSSGEFLSSQALLDLSDEKGKSLAQVAGSIISYLRRYSLGAVLGLYVDEDTDGSGSVSSSGSGSVKTQAHAKSPAAKNSGASLVEAAKEEGGVVRSAYNGKLAKLHLHEYPVEWGQRLVREFISTNKIDGGVPHLDGILQKLGLSFTTPIDDVVSSVSSYLLEKKE